jgi:hypothetical protein
VKALVISMLILLTAFFSLIPAFGQPPANNSPQPQLKEQKKEEPVKEPEHKKTADANAAADANIVVDTNAVADPNAVKARIGEFKGLGEALEQVNTESKDEVYKWTLSKPDDKLELALAVQKQITAELNFLRKLAIEEKAAKTTAAIDGILLNRQERSKGVIEKLEKESERLRRLSEREEKKSKNLERGKERSRDRKKEM